MTSRSNELRDNVLLAFHRACEHPTAEQVLAWVKRYPEFADDIRAHAAVVLDQAALSDEPKVEVSQSLQERTYSNALNALFEADQKGSATQHDTAQSFHDIAAARKIEVFEIANAMDVGRSVVADLFNGWMLPPVRQRLVAATCAALHISSEGFESAFALARANPRFGHAKANKTPTVMARSCDDIIRDSNTSPDRKRFFLEEE